MADEFPMTPAARARPGARGELTVSARGHAWRLSDHVPRPDAVWDRLYDSNLLRGGYDPGDVRMAAYRLLAANYELTPEEGVAIVLEADGVDPGAALAAVERALFGPAETHRTYSDWVTSALAANGLAYEDVPPGRLHSVLAQLVATGRAIPAEGFISAAEAAQLRATFSRFAAEQKAKAAPKAPPGAAPKAGP
jgi:hypothetical protein